MTMTKHLLIPLMTAVLLSAESVLAADEIPKAATLARYESMMNRSPFAVATAVAPAPMAPNFAKDLYIANAARLPGEGVVTLTSTTDKSMKEYLSTKGPNEHGYSVSNIEWSDRVGETKVTIAKDGQFATLTFNQALLSQPLASNPVPQQVQPMPMPVPGQPGLPQSGVSTIPARPNPNAIKPAPIPTLPTPPPRVRGVIQRNPVAPPTPIPDPDTEDE